MDTKSFMLGVSTALGLTLGGGAIVYNTSGEPVAVIRAEGTEEITGDAKAPLATKLDESGAQGSVVCRKGVIDNLPPETIYCTDGGTAGFVLSPEEAADLLGEADAKLAGVVADEVFIQAVDGKVYVGVQGVVAQ